MRVKIPLVAAVAALLPTAIALAEMAGGATDEDREACATCGLVGVLLFVVAPGVLLALNIALLVWVARDAKSRGMDNVVLWIALVVVTSLLGLLIYILSRPKGDLVQCVHCGKRRLQAGAWCPHCGNS